MMKQNWIQAKRFFATFVIGMLILCVDAVAQSTTAPAAPKAKGGDNGLRPIRVAVFDVGVVKGVDSWCSKSSTPRPPFRNSFQSRLPSIRAWKR